MCDERADVLATIPERWHFEVHDHDPVHQVFAELPLRDEVGQIPVRGGDDPDIHLPGCEIGADRLHFAAFQKAQEHRLHAQAHFPDFVQEHRASIAQLKEADLVAMRTSKAALHVTEELRLEERLRHARAIERHKGTLGARGSGMNQSCDEILPDAALSRDEHLRVAGGDTDRRRAEAFESGAASDERGFSDDVCMCMHQR